jgi:hypothetical protein
MSISTGYRLFFLTISSSFFSISFFSSLFFMSKQSSNDVQSAEKDKSSVIFVENTLPQLPTSSAHFEAEQEYYAAHPNRWAYIRKHYLRDAASEFLGCMILIM